MSASGTKNKARIFIMRMVAGMVVGAAASFGFLTAFGEPLKAVDDPGVMLAIMAGLIYLLIGLMVWIGMAAPTVGAHFLNVEDADELREETPKLRSGVIVLLLIGVFLMTLAVASAGMIAPAVALGISAGCLAGVVAAGWHGASRHDEMSKRMGEEVASATLQVTLLGLGAWAALAQLGYIAWVGPLALISVLAMLPLLVSFIVVGKKGMLMPR
jgi:hypothetical protein